METLSSHYARLLGLNDSWRVESVDLRLSPVGSGVFCPECGEACGLADHADERNWRHLDTMQFATELVARLPRSRCAEHGVKTIVPPWAGKHSRFTLLFEAFAIEVLQACRTVNAAAALLGLSWDAVQSIMDRAVARGLERRETTHIPHLGIDEKSFRKGHDYITVLADLDGSRVLDVVPERTPAVAKMLKRHLPNLLSYFLYRITNATSEGFNSAIQALKYAARGFRSFGNYRTRILFYCGRLDLRPQLPCH